MKNFKIINKALPKEVFNYYKDYLYSVIDDFYTDFEFSFKLSILITKRDKNNTQENSDAMAFIKRYGENYIIGLYNELVEQIKENGEENFELSILHEFAHIYDMISFNKIFSLQLNKNNYKSYDDFLTHEGFHFWTEYYAYFLTFKFYPKYQNATIFSLIKKYKNLNKMYEKIKHTIVDNIELRDEFVDHLNDFVYFSSLFIAGYHRGKSRHYQYCEKTLSSHEYKFIINFLNKLITPLGKIVNRPYGKNMTKYLIKIGELLFENLYSQYNFDLIKLKTGVVKFVCYEK
jgi:hypothetical protein